MLLARLMGEPALKMATGDFSMLDGLHTQHRRERDIVDWAYLAGVGDLMLCKWCTRSSGGGKQSEPGGSQMGAQPSLLAAFG